MKGLRSSACTSSFLAVNGSFWQFVATRCVKFLMGPSPRLVATCWFAQGKALGTHRHRRHHRYQHRYR